MTIALAAFVQLLHMVLIGLAALALMTLERTAMALLSGNAVPHPLQPWRDLVRLARKQGMVAETSSWLFRTAPAIGCAVTVVAASLVPSFALGMAFAPWADLLTVVSLLTLARLIVVVAALDPGTGLGGVAVAQRMRLVLPAEVALILAVMALALLSGSANLVQIAAAQLEALPAPHVSAALACMAVLAVALADFGGDTVAMGQEYSGLDVALLTGSDALRRLVWLNLIVLIFLPVGLAGLDAGLTAWVIGFFSWLGRLAVLGAMIGAIRAVVGALPARWMSPLLGVAGVLGALAIILALSRAGAA